MLIFINNMFYTSMHRNKKTIKILRNYDFRADITRKS